MNIEEINKNIEQYQKIDTRLDFFKGLKLVLQQANRLKGRLSPLQAWKTLLSLIPLWIIGLVFGVISLKFIEALGEPIWSFLILIIALSPGLYSVIMIFFAIPVLRLHDIGFSGWWILLINFIVRLIGETGLMSIETMDGKQHLNWAFIIAFILIYTIPSGKDENKYGQRLDW